MPSNEFDAMLTGAKPAESNEYDRLLNEQTSSNVTALRSAANLAAQTTPDRAASVIKLSERTGLPKGTVERDFDNVRSKVEVGFNDYDTMLSQSPKLSTWLKDGENYAVSKDDIERLGNLEWIVTAPQRAWKQGVAQVEFGKLRHESMFRDLSNAEQERLKALRTEMQAGGKLGAETWWGKALVGGAQQLPMLFGGLLAGAREGAPMALTFGTAAAIAGQVGPQIAVPEEALTVPAASFLGYRIGAAAGSAQFAFQQEAGHAYEEFLGFKDEHGQPLDRDVARVAAVAAGAINAGLEVFQLETLMRSIPGADKLAGGATRSAIKQALAAPSVRLALKELVIGYGKTMTAEVATEVAQRAVTIMAGEIGKATSGQKIERKKGVDVAADLANEAVEAAQAFTYIVAPGHVARFGQDALRIREAQKNEAFFTALGEGVSESKTWQRLPEKMQEFIRQATQDGPISNVYMPVQAWTQYWQSQNVDPAEAAREITGSAEAFENAVRTGEDLRISMADYATKIAPTDANKAFAHELRLGPDELNAREANELEKLLAAEAQKRKDAEQDQQIEDVHAQAAAQITENVRQKLMAAGMEDAIAANYAAMYGAAFRSFGERAGVDPAELYQRYGLRINRPELGATSGKETTLNQAKQYAPGEKHNGPVPEIKYLPLEAIHRQEMDFRPEVMKVSDEVAAGMDYSQPIEATAYRFGPNNEDAQPIVTLTDGHHRTAAALQTGRKYLPVNIKAINATGEKLNRLIEMSRKIEQELGATSLNQSASPGATINVDGLDRPTTNSLGKPITTSAEGLVNFWRWFGDSKVVDAQGRPLVVYHGTGNAQAVMAAGFSHDFIDKGSDAFGSGFYFTNKEQTARGYTSRRIDPDVEKIGGEESPGVLEVYLKIEKPVVIDGSKERAFTQFPNLTRAQVRKMMEGAPNIKDEEESPLVNWGDVSFEGYSKVFNKALDSYAKADSPFSLANDIYPGNAPAFLRNYSKITGYDGVIINYAATGENHYVAWFPTQIKSIDNRGIFDPMSGNLLEQRDPWQDQMQRALAGEGQAEGARGNITFGPDRQFDINLLKNANLSTFIHESGHFWLEVLSDINKELRKGDAEKLNDKQRRMVADFDTLMKWLGNDGGKLTSEQHEQFARGVEAYMMEGKAPTEALRSVFARFRAWLLSVYRSITKLNVELTPEVRGVMDRMLATDEEIAAAQAEAAVEPLFINAEMAGMTPVEFDAYRARVQKASDVARDELAAKLIKTITREREAWWKEQREVERDKVAEAIYQRPEYIALSVLQNDSMPNGDPLPYDLQRVKLNRKAVDGLFGEDAWKSLPRGTTATDGILPDTAAELFGFKSGADLVDTLRQARPMKAVIEQQTDAVMREKHGDPMVDGSMINAAMQATQNDDRLRVIEAEMRALAKLERQSRPAVQAERKQQREKREEGVRAIDRNVLTLSKAREMAARRIASTKVRDLQPNHFLSAARRASMEATKAAGAQDYTTAIALKRREMINIELYRQAMQAREEVEKSVDYMQKFGKATTRSRIGKAGQDYMDQIDGFLDRYEFARVPLTTLERRKQLQQWVADKERRGEPVTLPDDIQLENRVNYKDLTLDELRGVIDSVKHIEHLAKLKNKLLTAKRAQELDAAAQEIKDSIEANAGGGKRKIKFETRLPTEEGARIVSGWFGSHRKLSSFLREMDGFKDGGALWEYIMRPLNAAADAEAGMNRAAAKALQKLFNAYQGKDISALYVKSRIPALGESLTKMARLMIALNWGNADNRQKLMDGYKWNEEQVQSVLDTLDERDWKFVQGVWDYIDEFWPQIAAKEQRVNGVSPDKVEATPVGTRFGEFAGGYFPLKYDDRQSAKVHGQRVEELATLMMTGGYGRATTRRGHTKARTEGVTLPVRLDFGVIFEHVGQVIHDLSHHEALLDVNRVLTHKNVQGPMMEHYGDIVYKQIKDNIVDIAAGDIPAIGTFEKGLNWIRSGVTIAGMGWNVFTSMLQPLGLAQSITRIGPKWVAVGLSRWMRDAVSMENTAAWIKEVSPLMRNRMDTQIREINEIRQQVGLNTGKFSGWVDAAMRGVSMDMLNKQAVVDSYFWLIYKGQQIADIPTWIGAYEKALSEGNDEARSIALADQAVLDSQGGGQMKDLAAIQRGGPLLKLWTAFYSYFNVTYNLTVEAGKRGSFKNPAHLARFAVDTLLLYTVPATLGFMMKHALVGPDDDDKYLEKLIRENLSYAFGIMIGLREIGSVIQGFGGYEGPAGARFFSSIAKLIKQSEQGELDAAFWKSLNQTAGILFHYPAGQVQRSVDGFVSLMEGETKNPLALIVGPQKDK